MDQPENLGDDKEDLLSSLAKVTYHIRRDRAESNRVFFNRWEDAMRRVTTHQVVLPDAYKGFLLINALNLGDQDIKNMMNFTRGSIATKDVKEWLRKHETKLMAKEVGIESMKTKAKATSGTSSATSMRHLNADENMDYHDEDEILEAVLEELNDEDDGDLGEDGNEAEEDALDEHEVKEVLNTMYQKRTFSQSMKLKKAKELARGFGGWKGSGKEKGKGGKGKLVDQLKQNSRCAICKKIGHWHRECPEGKGRGKTTTKETYYMETMPKDPDAGAYFCGHLEVPTETEKEDMKDFNDEKLFLLTDPDEKDDREIYGEQYRHFEENYDGLEGWPEFSDVEKDVVATSPMPPSVAKPSSSSSPAEPEGGSEIDLFDVVTSSHHVAGGVHMPHSRYKVQCAVIGGNIGEDKHEVFFVGGDSNLQGRATENHDKPNDRRRTSIHRHRQSTSSNLEGTKHDDGCATIDTGRQRMAVGEETLHRLARQLPQKLEIGLAPQEHRFRSVNGPM